MRKILFLLLLAFPCTSRIAAQDIHFIGKRSVDTCHAKANCKNPILWKLKTNLLYDAFVVPNISAEMHLGRNWSAGLGYWYTWWKTNPCHRYWRSYGGEIDIRKYFGSQALKSHLTGHHLGAVSQIGMYDVEFGYLGHYKSYKIIHKSLTGSAVFKHLYFASGYKKSIPYKRYTNKRRERCEIAHDLNRILTA